MDNDVLEVLQKTAAYIAAVQPQADQYDAVRALFQKRASAVADVCVSKNIIPRERRESFAEKLASNPNEVFNLLIELTNHVAPASLGQGGSVKLAGAAPVRNRDPFVQAYLPELVR